MSRTAQRDEDARRRANELLTKNKRKEADALKARDKERVAETEKTLRLRALRLAKEAADKAAAVPVPLVVAKRRPAKA